MKDVKRVIIPLLLSMLILALLILAGCKGNQAGGTATGQPAGTSESQTNKETGKTEPAQTYEILTGVPLGPGETPVVLLPEDEKNETVTISSDGSTSSFDLSTEATPPKAVKEVKVDGKTVTDFTFDPETSILELAETPAEGATIEVEVTLPKDEPPATTEPPATEPPVSTEPVTSSTSGWTGPPETPIIPYKPSTSEGSEEDGGSD